MKKFLDTSEKYGITFNQDKVLYPAAPLSCSAIKCSINSIKSDPDQKPQLELPAPTDITSQRIVGMFAYYSRWINFSSKIHPLVENTTFPVPGVIMSAFNTLKNDLTDATLTAIDPLIVETDASKVAIGTTLTQNGSCVLF